MLKALSYDVTFPTGKRFAGEWTFEKGLTAISGSNEAGKTLILEFISYGFWGTKALRGNGTDYRTLKLELEFEVHGVGYAVNRLGSKADLFRRDGSDILRIIATGAAPVNAKIIEIFGYDMAVFDVANNISQGEVEALGKMTSGERKKMVDQTIGLNVLDELDDWLAANATTEKKLYEALSEVLVEPVAPDLPHDYQPSTILVAAQGELSQRVTDFDQITGWLSARQSLKKPDPVTCSIIETVEDLRVIDKRRQAQLVAINSRKDQLSRLQPLADGTTDEVLLAAHQQWHQAAVKEKLAATVARFQKPKYDTFQLAEMDQQLEAIEIAKRLEKLRETTMTCPECECSFPHEHEEVVELEKKLTGITVTGESPLTGKEIVMQQVLVAEWLATKDERKVVEDGLAALSHIGEPSHSMDKIKDMHAQLEDDVVRRRLTAEIEEIEPVLAPDRGEDLQVRLQFEEADRQFKFRMTEWEKFVAEKDGKLARLAEVTGSSAALTIINAKLVESRSYEASSVVYDRAKALFDANFSKADAAKQKAEKLDKARRAIKALKVAIKGHLVPSLNQVSSHLLSQMTATERNTIEIGEDFEIQVDGQPINTLSGSGKAVANLAIRVGLGQVLTNKVFSVLMGDEIDASMDANRAGYTAECMQRLTSSIGQVILVSHKPIDAQHHIEVS